MTKTNKQVKKRGKKTKRVIAWADIGSHGGIFAFAGGGECSRAYEGMMHIYKERHSKDLIKVVITYEI